GCGRKQTLSVATRRTWIGKRCERISRLKGPSATRTARLYRARSGEKVRPKLPACQRRRGRLAVWTRSRPLRPALQRLLEDITAGTIDVVLAYKVDRLSRSLLDFARIMEIFDKHQVAFVSITQQFHSATSMGRLVLNMLLSFAQFERELIA